MHDGSFNAALSPGELGLCTHLGARPLTQVMGACAYTIGVSGAPVLGDPGYREYFGRGRHPGPVMFELRRVSSAYNDARQTALRRLREQAAQTGAHLVIGVAVTLDERDVGGVQTVEYVATGTAMRLHRGPAKPEPHLSPLSISAWWCLRQAGYEPAGLAAATVVYYARPSTATTRALGKRGWGAARNRELADLSTAATSARDACQARMADQARRQGATGVVGMSLELSHTIGFGLRPEGDSGRNQSNGNLHLTVHGLGAAVRPLPKPGPRASHATPRAVLWMRDA